MKSMETSGNSSRSAEKGCDPKLRCSAGCYINLCTIHFYDKFAKYRNLAKNIASEKVVVDSLQPKALAKSLRL